MNKTEFDKVARIYLSPSAKPLDIEEYKHRGCTIWTFRRRVKKWRPTAEALWKFHKDGMPIPESGKEYYTHEFWMAISDYFLVFDVEFENTVEKELSESMDRKEAIHRINSFIDRHYADTIVITQNIM